MDRADAYPYITNSETSPSQNLPTNSGEEAGLVLHFPFDWKRETGVLR